MIILRITAILATNLFFILRRPKIYQTFIIIIEYIIMVVIRSLNQVTKEKTERTDYIDELMLRSSLSQYFNETKLDNKKINDIKSVVSKIIRNQIILALIDNEAKEDEQKDEILNIIKLNTMLIQQCYGGIVFLFAECVKTVTTWMMQKEYINNLNTEENLNEMYLGLDMQWNIMNIREQQTSNKLKRCLRILMTLNIVNFATTITIILSGYSLNSYKVNEIVNLMIAVSMTIIERLTMLKKLRLKTAVLKEAGRRRIENIYSETIFDAASELSDNDSDDELFEENI